MAQNGIRPIRTEQEHTDALGRIELLMDSDLTPEEEDEFEILAALIEHYEDKHYPMDKPTPIGAIKFRMEQSGMTQRDLIPLIGSRSKVSEVLNGKRELTLKMIRALHEHLNIPADVLISGGGELSEIPSGIEFDRFPINEMGRRGWIKKTPDLKEKIEENIRGLINRAGGWKTLPKTLFRQSNGMRVNTKTDEHALLAWCIYILCKARQTNLEGIYKQGTIVPAFLRDLAKLSRFDNGPKLAKEKLAKHGISLVAEKHLPKTYLDGAALWTVDKVPVVGMTIRYDRLDNFWFCLLHELAHLGCHLTDGNGEVFIDDHELRGLNQEDSGKLEREADEWATEALIPARIWKNHPVQLSPNEKNVRSLAREAEVHPAIVAGRIRHERHNYRLLSHIVGKLDRKLLD